MESEGQGIKQDKPFGMPANDVYASPVYMITDSGWLLCDEIIDGLRKTGDAPGHKPRLASEASQNKEGGVPPHPPSKS